MHVGAISVPIAVVIGARIGLIAGYYGGLVDDMIARPLDVVFALPDPATRRLFPLSLV